MPVEIFLLTLLMEAFKALVWSGVFIFMLNRFAR